MTTYTVSLGDTWRDALEAVRDNTCFVSMSSTLTSLQVRGLIELCEPSREHKAGWRTTPAGEWLLAETTRSAGTIKDAAPEGAVVKTTKGGDHMRASGEKPCQRTDSAGSVLVAGERPNNPDRRQENIDALAGGPAVEGSGGLGGAEMKGVESEATCDPHRTAEASSEHLAALRASKRVRIKSVSSPFDVGRIEEMAEDASFVSALTGSKIGWFPNEQLEPIPEPDSDSRSHGVTGVDDYVQSRAIELVDVVLARKTRETAIRAAALLIDGGFVRRRDEPSPDEGHPHLINGEFQSDKYPTTPRGKVPLSVKDPTAQDLLWEYAQRRRVVDAEFATDLETALRLKGFTPHVDDALPRKAGDAVWVKGMVERNITLAAANAELHGVVSVLLAYRDAHSIADSPIGDQLCEAIGDYLKGPREAPSDALPGSVQCTYRNGKGRVVLPEEIDTTPLFYFGCWEQPGHFLIDPKAPWNYLREDKLLPEELRHGRIDGGFCPGTVKGDPYKRTRLEVEGEAKLSHVAGWTVLGWWDRSVDKRGACNSNLIAKGTFDFTTMLEIGKRRTPTVMSRQRQPIKLVDAPPQMETANKITGADQGEQ